MITWAAPWCILLLVLPFVIYFLFPAARKLYGDALRVPFIGDFLQIKENSAEGGLSVGRATTSAAKTLLWGGVWIFTVLALCRPQLVGEPLPIKNKGRDILLVVDISNSMSTRDFRYQNRAYTRIDAVKNVVGQFADMRRDDRMGLILFGTRAYLQVPLTYDKISLKEVLQATDAGMAGQSTAIGDALGLAVKNLAEDAENKKSQVIILLTDGENNDGRLSLAQAVKLAKEENIKVYTIGVGSDDTAFFGGFFGVAGGSQIDEAGLKQLADETKGSYFRAKDVNSLVDVYAKIDKLEPREQQGRFVQETEDLFYYPAALALILFMLATLLSRKVW